jgi:competence protein ComEC
LLIPLLAIIAGLSTACLSGFFFPSLILPPLLAATLACVFLKNRIPFLLTLFLCLFVWGDLSLEPLLSPRFPADSIVRYAGHEAYLVEGIVDGRPEWLETGGRLSVRVTRLYRAGRSGPACGRLLLYVGEGRGELLSGDLVRFESRIRRPRNFGIPGEFDYERYLALRETYATAFVPSASHVILVRSGVLYPLQNFMDGLAAQMGNRIGRLVPGGDGAVLRALILGEGGPVPRSIKDLYTRTGVNHILSISGFHVGVIAFFIFHLLLRAARCSQFLLLHANIRRSVLLLTVPVLIFYLFLTGSAPATIRSVIMITAFIAALLLERETDPVNSLMLAALCILGSSPAALFDISFQLSFMAIWGIIALTPILMGPFGSMEQGIPRKLLLFFMVSVAATATTLVPVSLHFHRTTLTGLIANFFVIPLMGYGAVVLGFSALPFMDGFPPVAEMLLTAAGFLVHLSGDILVFLDRLPLLPAWRTSALDFLLALLALAAVTFLPGKRSRIACCCSLAVLFVTARILSVDAGSGKLRIDFFSVGQGESTLVTFPDGRRMLVDGGGSSRDGGADPGERLLAPALWSMGVDRLDYMVLTHPHPDHLKGLLFPARVFEIGEFWETGISDGSEEYRTLREILDEKGVPVRRVNASTGPIAIGVVRIEPLAPLAPGRLQVSGGDEDLNEESLVFRLSIGGFALLFTGDIGWESEERLSRTPASLRCSVLKVPHHGSRHSSSDPFIAAAAPACSLIGAGFDNRFGLPAQETLSSLRRRGGAVFRTDLDGTVTVIYGNGKWTVSTFRGGRHFN